MYHVNSSSMPMLFLQLHMCSEIHEGYMNTITRLKDSIKTTVLCSSIGKSPDHDVLTVSYTPKGAKKKKRENCISRAL